MLLSYLINKGKKRKKNERKKKETKKKKENTTTDFGFFCLFFWGRVYGGCACVRALRVCVRACVLKKWRCQKIAPWQKEQPP